MPSLKIEFTGGTSPLTLDVATSSTAPAVKKLVKQDPPRSKADQLRDHLWSGDWQGKDTCVIVWDSTNNRWLIWES